MKTKAVRKSAAKKVRNLSLAKAKTTYVFAFGNGWVIKNSNSSKFSAFSDRKLQTISLARIMARTKKYQLIVYGKTGQIELCESY